MHGALCSVHMHISRVFSVISAIICAAMPKACTFEAPLADSFEDSRAIREIFRSRKALLGWKSEEEKGLPSLKALGFNTKVMCKFAEVFCSRCSCVKSPPIAWIRKEVGLVCMCGQLHASKIEL